MVLVPHWLVGAAREVAGTGVEALASVDEEDSMLVHATLALSPFFGTFS